MTLATIPTTELVPFQPTPIEKSPALIYLARLAPGSRRTMRGALDQVAELLQPGADAFTFPWSEVRYQHAQFVRAYLAEKLAPNTVNKILAALRGCLKEAWRLGQIGAEDFARACDLDRVRGSRLPAGRGLTTGEVRSLFAACASDLTASGRRDAALLGILYGGGLRRAEAAALEVDDYSDEVGTLTIRCGKGNKARVVKLPVGSRQAINAWLKVRGPDDGGLLLAVNKGGRIQTSGMSASAIYLRLRLLAARAGVSEFSPHDLRRSFISDLLDAGADIAAVQAQAGHSSVSTTARYDRRGLRAQEKAAELLHVPFRVA